MHGYTRLELKKMGWRWHDAKRSRWIILCKTCQKGLSATPAVPSGGDARA